MLIFIFRFYFILNSVIIKVNKNIWTYFRRKKVKMLNSKKVIPSLSSMISKDLINKFVSILFDDINNADDGTLIVYFLAEFMKSFYKPYCESLEPDDIVKRNIYFDFYNNDLINISIEKEKSDGYDVEFKKGAILISNYYTNSKILNRALGHTAKEICKKYRDEKPESEWDDCFHRKYATAFKKFLFDLGDEVYILFRKKIKENVLKYLSDLKILLEDYSGSTINKGIEYNTLNLENHYQNFIIDNKLDPSLMVLIKESFNIQKLYVTFNPEIVGIDLILKKVSFDYKERIGNSKDLYYIRKFIAFLIDNVCSLEELITSVPNSVGEDVLFDLAITDNVSQFISTSKPKDIKFFVKKVRTLLFDIKNINLEGLAVSVVDDLDKRSGLSELLQKITIAMDEYDDCEINYEIINNFLIEDPISKDDIDQLVKSLSKIQLLIWQDKVIFPEVIAEKYELAILGINTFLKLAEDRRNINKDIYNYFTSKFFRTIDRKYIKEAKASIRTVIYKLILDLDIDKIPVSLKVLQQLSTQPYQKNLLISNTFVPRDKKIILCDLPGLNFDDSLMNAISKINSFLNIVDADLKVCYNESESESWNLLTQCIKYGHLDFNPHLKEAKSSLKSLNLIS